MFAIELPERKKEKQRKAGRMKEEEKEGLKKKEGKKGGREEEKTQKVTPGTSESLPSL